MSIASEAIWAASPTTERGQPTPLSADPKGERLAYASNKSVFLRSINDPAVSTQYTAHTVQTTVARFSPSGYYVASGDVSGMVRVWDAVGEGATKGEYAIISGRINDIAWDGDSQRLIAVGEGKERFGHCITADSGNSVGEISGHSSRINTVAIRQQRPLRAATGSDDTSLVFYHGAPFKFNTSLRGQHDRFVFGTQFSPDGSTLVSVGADKRIHLYDGKTGEPRGQIGEGVHTGSIFGVSWAGDSKRFVTASADQTVRIWDVEAGKAVQTWRMGEEGVVSIPDQQMGVVWPGGRSDGLVVSVDLEGNLNYLHEGSEKPTKVVRGHQKNITAASIAGKTFFTGSYEGRVLAWDVDTGLADKVDGETHTNYVAGLAASPTDDAAKVYSIGWDDTLRTIDVGTKSFAGSKIGLDAQPKALTTTAAGLTLVASANPNRIALYTASGTLAGTLDNLPYAPTALAAHPTAPTIVIGGDDKALHIYTLDASSASLSPVPVSPRKATAAITALAFTRQGHRLAAGTAAGKILAYDAVATDWPVLTDRWSAHTARVTALAWDPVEGAFAVSAGLDTAIFVWSLENPGRRVGVRNAHKDGVAGLAFLEYQGGKGRVLSAGGDGAVKGWFVEGL